MEAALTAVRVWASRFDHMQFARIALWLSAGSLISSVLLFMFPKWTVAAIVVSAAILSIGLWRVYSGRPESGKNSNKLLKIRKKREVAAIDKHRHINEQIEYIEIEWGYSKEQKRTIERFLKERAYSQMYNRLTASLLPQLITLVDQCNERGQSGCKREVSRRIRELTLLMKEELKRKKSRTVESFETSLEVFDRLLDGK